MQFRKPTSSEMKWFGAGYGAGALTFPMVKRLAIRIGAGAVGFFHRDEEEDESEVAEISPRSRSTTAARKAANAEGN